MLGFYFTIFSTNCTNFHSQLGQVCVVSVVLFSFSGTSAELQVFQCFVRLVCANVSLWVVRDNGKEREGKGIRCVSLQYAQGWLGQCALRLRRNFFPSTIYVTRI